MDFVSFETAKKLKEKGYGESWDYVYNDDGVICIPCYNLTEEDTIPMCPAPQIHEVLKWLREEKKIYVIIEPFPSCSNINNVTWIYKLKYNSDGDSLNFKESLFSFETYEEAALAGISYVLDNLI